MIGRRKRYNPALHDVAVSLLDASRTLYDQAGVTDEERLTEDVGEMVDRLLARAQALEGTDEGERLCIAADRLEGVLGDLDPARRRVVDERI